MASFTSGYHNDIGKRPTNEDCHIELNHPAFNTEVGLEDGVSRRFFAVFDGHGGIFAAQHCADSIPGTLVHHTAFVGDAENKKDLVLALTETLLYTEEHLNHMQGPEGEHLGDDSGTTACIGYIEGNTLIVANIGDSRAVLCSGGKAKQLTTDHKPTLESEKKRIEAAGGHVGKKEADAKGDIGCITACCNSIKHSGLPSRVWPGGLSVSRTLGDSSVKAAGRYVIPDPEISEYTLGPDDEFMTICCDGVFDVMTNEQTCEAISRHLDDPEGAAQTVVEEALFRGSTDNVSCMVIVFKPTDKGGSTKSVQIKTKQ